MHLAKLASGHNALQLYEANQTLHDSSSPNTLLYPSDCLVSQLQWCNWFHCHRFGVLCSTYICQKTDILTLRCLIICVNVYYYVFEFRFSVTNLFSSEKTFFVYRKILFQQSIMPNEIILELLSFHSVGKKWICVNLDPDSGHSACMLWELRSITSYLQVPACLSAKWKW